MNTEDMKSVHFADLENLTAVRATRDAIEDFLAAKNIEALKEEWQEREVMENEGLLSSEAFARAHELELLTADLRELANLAEQQAHKLDDFARTPAKYI